MNENSLIANSGICDKGRSGVYLDLTLFPHRSMGRSGQKALAWVLIIPGLIVAALSMAFGTWPIFVFYVLHTAVLYWMIRYHWFIGQGYERLVLTHEILEVHRVSAFGVTRVEHVTPQWLQVMYPDAPTKDDQLLLAHHGTGVEIGAFLTMEEKSEIAIALIKALRARRDALVFRD